MANNIIIGLIIFIVFVLGLGAWDIRQNNIKTIVSGQAHAGILDDIKDAITGHIDDYNDRKKSDQFIDGEIVKKSEFSWSSDSIHYATGNVEIINNNNDLYVQLEQNFNAGFAPDLYIYVAKGHITSDDGFRNAQKMEIGKLIKGEGASYYKVPEVLEQFINEKFSIVIHCKRFDEPMGASHFNG